MTSVASDPTTCQETVFLFSSERNRISCNAYFDIQGLPSLELLKQILPDLSRTQLHAQERMYRCFVTNYWEIQGLCNVISGAEEKTLYTKLYDSLQAILDEMDDDDIPHDPPPGGLSAAEIAIIVVASVATFLVLLGLIIAHYAKKYALSASGNLLSRALEWSGSSTPQLQGPGDVLVPV